MLELGRREHHLMGGLGLQILVVGLLVFAYTQAIRQIQHQRSLRDSLQEQLTMAREEVARSEGQPDLSALQDKSASLIAHLRTREIWEAALPGLGQLARERFGIENPKIEFSKDPVETVAIPLEEELNFQVQLHALTLDGRGTSRQIARLAAYLNDPALVLLCPLTSLKLSVSEETVSGPVDFSLGWSVATAPIEQEGWLLSQIRPEEPPPIVWPADKRKSLDWGRRIEPFQSPFLYPAASRVSDNPRFRLKGILWDAKRPACVINGTTLQPGDWIEGYQLILILPKAILLQSGDEELLLGLS